MYPYGSSLPDHFKYDMSFQNFSGEDSTSPVQNISHSDINENPDPVYIFPPTRDYIAQNSYMLLLQTHSQMQPTFDSEMLPLVNEQEYNGMPDLHQHSNIHPAAHALTFDSFERSTAASEYSYSDSGYEPITHYGSHMEVETYTPNTSTEIGRAHV